MILAPRAAQLRAIGNQKTNKKEVKIQKKRQDHDSDTDSDQDLPLNPKRIIMTYIK